MNKIGMHYGYWNNNWDVDLIEYVLKVSKLGFDILGVDSGVVLGLTTNERKNLKEIIKRENIELTFCIGLPAQYDISAADGTIRQNGIEYLKKIIEMINEMGSSQLSGVMFGEWNPTFSLKDINKKAFLERSVGSMKKIIKTAEDFGVFCNVEPVNRFEQFILNTCEEAIDYVDRVQSPNLNILLDTFHMNIEEDSMEKAIVTAGNKLGHLHFGENNRRPPGLGQLDWNEIINALKKADYQGRIVMEPFVKMGGEIGEDIKVFRNLAVGLDLDEEARKSLIFIKKLLSN